MFTPQIESQNISQASVSMGLALKALDQTLCGFNFRKGEFAYQKFFEHSKKPIALTATLFLLLVLLVASFIQWRSTQNRKAYDKLLAFGQEVAARQHEPFSLDTVGYFDKIYHLRESLKQRLEEAENAIPQPADSFERWQVISQVIGELRKQYYFTVEHLFIGQTEAMLEGRLAENQELLFDALKQKIKQLSFVSPGDDALNVLPTQVITEPKNPKLTRQYKVIVKFRE